jgi:hypothetical protein
LVAWIGGPMDPSTSNLVPLIKPTKLMLLIHPRCVCGIVDVQDPKHGTWQVRAHLPCVARWSVHVP